MNVYHLSPAKDNIRTAQQCFASRSPGSFHGERPLVQLPVLSTLWNCIWRGYIFSTRFLGGRRALRHSWRVDCLCSPWKCINLWLSQYHETSTKGNDGQRRQAIDDRRQGKSICMAHQRSKLGNFWERPWIRSDDSFCALSLCLLLCPSTETRHLVMLDSLGRAWPCWDGLVQVLSKSFPRLSRLVGSLSCWCGLKSVEDVC